jgi:hypothetical protein
MGDRDAARTELEKAMALDASEPEVEELRKALAKETPAAGRTP